MYTICFRKSEILAKSRITILSVNLDLFIVGYSVLHPTA